MLTKLLRIEDRAIEEMTAMKWFQAQSHVSPTEEETVNYLKEITIMVLVEMEVVCFLVVSTLDSNPEQK